MCVTVQRGSSLVEVMIALFVLAIGLLGVLAMQTTSMQYNQSANTYSQAVYIANDIAERIRSNNAGDYSDLNITAAPTIAAYEAALSTCNAAGTLCSADAIKDRDEKIIAWNVTRRLPSGRATVEPVNFEGRSFLNITVAFDDSRVNRAVEGVQPEAEERSYSLVVEI